MRVPKRFTFYMPILFSLIISFTAVFTADAASSYTILFNETEQISDGLLIEGINYIPLKPAVEKLGYHVEWSQSNHTLMLYTPGRTIEIKTEIGEVKVNGKVYTNPNYTKNIILKKGTTFITVKDLALITGSQLNMDGKIIKLNNGNRFVFGESGQFSFWISTNGEVYSMVKSELPKPIGKLGVSFNEQRYSKIVIVPIASTNSFVITVNTFSGEPLIINTSLKVFVKNNQILQSVTFGDEEAPQTAQYHGLWVFSDSRSIKYVNNKGEVVQSYNLTDLIEEDQYSIDGFVGDHLVLVRSKTKKVLWVLDTNTHRSALLYKGILSANEQSSIEKNTDTADMHYGDNLHLLSVKGDLLTFSYFSYLQGAKQSEITIDIKKLENSLKENLYER